MVRHLKAGLIGGIILFVWGFISWMVLPWHNMTMHEFGSEVAVAQIIQANVAEPGVYMLPSPKKPTEVNAPDVKPFVFAAVMTTMPSSMTKALVVSFLTQFVAAFLVAWMLARTNNKLSYVGRVGFVVVFALAASIIKDIPMWNWFGFDACFTLVNMADTVVGWLLAGLVLAKFSVNGK